MRHTPRELEECRYIYKPNRLTAYKDFLVRHLARAAHALSRSDFKRVELLIEGGRNGSSLYYV